MKEGWTKPKGGAAYGGTSERTLRGDWLKNGLRHVRLPSGRILIKFSWIDEFLGKYEVKPDDTVGELVDDIMKGLGNGD